MSQNGQVYTLWELSRLLGVKQDELLNGERGVVLKRIEAQHGGYDREAVDRWIRFGQPTPSSVAGAAGRMDYTLLTRDQVDLHHGAGGRNAATITSAEADELRATVIDVVRQAVREGIRSGEIAL